MAPELSDGELLTRIAKRDLEALGELYDRLAPRLLGVVARILSSRELAEEVVQDMFLKAWSAAPTLHQGQHSVAAWLVVMARHAALVRLRAERSPLGRPRTRSDEGEHGPSASASRARPSPTKPHASKPRAEASAAATFLESAPEAWIPRPEEIALLDERLDLLQRVFNELPKPQRQALDLAVFGGYTEEEIAQELGEPLGKARTALRAAITFLRHRRRAVLGTWVANL